MESSVTARRSLSDGMQRFGLPGASCIGLLIWSTTAGCITPAEDGSTTVIHTGVIYHEQFPDDTGNKTHFDNADIRVIGFTDREGREVGRVLTTGDLQADQIGLDAPADAEVWRWSPDGLARTWAGDSPHLEMRLVYDPVEWNKAEAYGAFFADTAGWSSWVCGRKFVFGERRFLVHSQAKGHLVYRVRAPDDRQGPSHLLELRFDPAEPTRPPAAYFHLEASSLDRHLARSGMTFDDMPLEDAMVVARRARLYQLDDGEPVETVPLLPLSVVGADCSGPGETTAAE